MFMVFMSDEELEAARTQANISIGTIFMTFLTSLLISLLLGTQIEASWLLLGTLQLMSLTPLFNLNLPANFREFTKNLAVLHAEPEAIPNIFEYTIDTKGLKPFNKLFSLMSKLTNHCLDFKTTLLLIN
jgi:hypothetical protein